MQKKKSTLPTPGGGKIDASRVPKPSTSKEDSAFIKKMKATHSKPDSTAKKGKKQ